MIATEEEEAQIAKASLENGVQNPYHGRHKNHHQPIQLQKGFLLRLLFTIETDTFKLL